MRSVKFTIQGSYWDSQIYSGELLLLDDQGSIHKIDWRAAVDFIANQNINIQTALRVAFADSDLFYNEKVRKILRDPLIEHPIKDQLGLLGSKSLDVNKNYWKKFWRTEDTPFNFLPTDTDIYYNHLFAGGESGLFSVPRTGGDRGRLFDKLASKHHDANILQVKASDRYTAIATAAGSDGLFEFPFKKDEEQILQGERRIANRPCSACDWAFRSVVGWTPDSAFLASFTEDTDRKTNKNSRKFERIVEMDEIFKNKIDSQNNSGFTWGSREKLYRFTDTGIEVTDYQPGNKKSSSSSNFLQRGHVDVNFDSTSVIATGTAPFGTVIELDDSVFVLRSDGKIEKYDGEPVHWRIFPRSDHYSNQLHLIYEDRLDIISFVHDYFVDQDKKLNGFTRGK